jgi:hypothetical protein
LEYKYSQETPKDDEQTQAEEEAKEVAKED